MPELMRGLGVRLPGHAVQRWQQFERRGMHELQYGSRFRQLRAVGRPLVIAGLIAAASLFGIRQSAKRLGSRQ